jgi:hypothetical protein
VVEADDCRSAFHAHLTVRTSDQVSFLRSLQLEGAPSTLVLDLDRASDRLNVMRCHALKPPAAFNVDPGKVLGIVPSDGILVWGRAAWGNVRRNSRSFQGQGGQ